MESITSGVLEPWGSFFQIKRSKFNAVSKKAMKDAEKVCSFSDNIIWTGSGKLSILLREYS